MNPAELYPLSKDLNVIPHLVVGSLFGKNDENEKLHIVIELEYLSWAKKDELATNNHQYCCYC
jgi:hypothetical protein